MVERIIEYGYNGLRDDPSPEEIAPAEDNPLSQLMRWGMTLAGSVTRLSEPVLWPREYDHNPMLIYLTARRRGRWVEDWLGMGPWVALSLVEMVLALLVFDARKFGETLKILALCPLLVAPFVGLLSCRMVARSLDETFHRLSFDQIAVTRLSGGQVLHGLVIRPLTIQTLGCLLNTVLWLPHLLLAVSQSSKSTGAFFYQLGAGIALLLLRWALFTSCIMEGAALAARALCFIRSPSFAFLRIWIDWVRRMLAPMTVLALLAAVSAAIALASALAILGGVAILIYYVRLGFTAEDVMRWTAEHTPEWWAVSGEEGGFTPKTPWERWRSPDPDFTQVPQP